MKKFLVCFALLAISLGCFAKDNFKMSGKIDGVKKDTLVVLYTLLKAIVGENEVFYKYLDDTLGK